MRDVNVLDIFTKHTSNTELDRVCKEYPYECSRPTTRKATETEKQVFYYVYIKLITA